MLSKTESNMSDNIWKTMMYKIYGVYTRPLFSAGNSERKVGQTGLLFGVRSGFISRSVLARLQVSACSGYDLCHPG